MRQFLFVVLFLILHQVVYACTIVAVTGRATTDGRPLLMKNRDSSLNDIFIKIGTGSRYIYLCQCNSPDGPSYCGYNETGFSIINSHSYNMPNANSEWNAYIMQLALEKCVTVDDFEHLLDSLPKPISVCANYGVMDALGNVAIIETNAYNHVRYNADDSDCGYLIRTNYSFSQDTTGVSTASPTSFPRYQISSSFLEEIYMNCGTLTKEDLFNIARCLVDCNGIDLSGYAPFDEHTPTPVDFRYYVPRYKTTSAMVIQGVLPNEDPKMTVAWTMAGPPIASVTVPYIITPRHALPEKAKLGADGHSWFCYRGQQLKNNCFLDNNTLDLALLYNLCETGVMQKISFIEEQILDRGNELVDKLRIGEAHCYDIEQYYAWVDDYVEEQYEQYNLLEMNPNESINEAKVEEGEIEYYDVLGRRVRYVREGAVIKRSGKIAIVLN